MPTSPTEGLRLRHCAVALLLPLLAPACGDPSPGRVRAGDLDAGASTPITPPDAAPALAPDGGFGSTSPCHLAGTAQGCEFYSAAPYPHWIDAGSCFAALVVNAGTSAIAIDVAYGSQSLDVASLARIPQRTGAAITYAPLPNGKLDPGQMAVLFLSRWDNPDSLDDHDCPAGITPGVAVDPSVQDTGRATAFHITTSGPVAAFDMFPYGKGDWEKAEASASLLLPVKSWGTRYVGVDPYQADPRNLAADGSCATFLQIIASQDDTHVTVRPTANVYGDHGVTAPLAGTAATYSLAKGDVLQLSTGRYDVLFDSATDTLTGTPVTSDKPVAVVGGSPGVLWYGYSPNDSVPERQCDSSHQAIPPSTALGASYVVARYRDRDPAVHEKVPYTIVGLVDGTTLTYDPAPPADAPTALQAGQFVLFHEADAFSVRSQDARHPFYLAGHMTSQVPPAAQGQAWPVDAGEPELVSALPPEQWQTGYTFLTDPTFRNTNLVFVRQKAEDGTFHDVTLDCAGTLTGWAPIGSAGQYEVARVDTVIKAAPQGPCADGPHAASSTVAFALTVWAMGQRRLLRLPRGRGARADQRRAAQVTGRPPTPHLRVD